MNPPTESERLHLELRRHLSGFDRDLTMTSEHEAILKLAEQYAEARVLEIPSSVESLTDLAVSKAQAAIAGLPGTSIHLTLKDERWRAEISRPHPEELCYLSGWTKTAHGAITGALLSFHDGQANPKAETT